MTSSNKPDSGSGTRQITPPSRSCSNPASSELALLKSVVFPGGRDLDDHVDVVGWSEFRRRPSVIHSSTVAPPTKTTSSRRSPSCSAASSSIRCFRDSCRRDLNAQTPSESSVTSPRSRALPTRTASNKAGAQQSRGHAEPHQEQQGAEDRVKFPEPCPTRVAEPEHSLCEADRRSASGGAAHAVGIPLTFSVPHGGKHISSSIGEKFKKGSSIDFLRRASYSPASRARARLR